MKKKPQGRFEGTLVGAIGKSRLGVIASNWLFQGMRYMNAYEIVLKLTIDVMLAAIIIGIFGWWESAPGITIGIVGAHTINWILNGHIFVLLRYVWPIPKSKDEFQDYVGSLTRSAQKNEWIDGVAIFGSYCRGMLHEHSDLDVRVTVRPGGVNGFMGAVFCAMERIKAFFRVFPLDIYCCVELRSLDRLRDDESPVILIDRSGMLSRKYAQPTRHVEDEG